jgi:hypothetical protein
MTPHLRSCNADPAKDEAPRTHCFAALRSRGYRTFVRHPMQAQVGVAAWQRRSAGGIAIDNVIPSLPRGRREFDYAVPESRPR